MPRKKLVVVVTRKKENKKEKRRVYSLEETNPETGFKYNTDANKIAEELMKGGKDRPEIVFSLRQMLPRKTSTGKPKQVGVMVSQVARRMIAKGYVVESWYRIVHPEEKRNQKAS